MRCDFDFVFDAGKLAQFPFDDDAVCMSVFDDFFRQRDVVFKRVFGAVNHNGRKAAVDAVFACFKVSTVVQMKGNGQIMIFQGSFQ